MKEVPLGEDGRVLLINDGGKLSAVAHKCTHYGAPLEKGFVNLCDCLLSASCKLFVAA